MSDAFLKALFGDQSFVNVTLTPEIEEPEGTERTKWLHLDGTDATKDVGHLPLIFRTGDPRSAREQVEARYQHGGGYRVIPGFTVLLHGVALIYPGNGGRNSEDEIYAAIGKTVLDSGETVTLFERGFVLIYTPGKDDDTPATRAIILMD